MINPLASLYQLFRFVYWLLKSADLPLVWGLEGQGWDRESDWEWTSSMGGTIIWNNTNDPPPKTQKQRKFSPEVGNCWIRRYWTIKRINETFSIKYHKENRGFTLFCKQGRIVICNLEAIPGNQGSTNSLKYYIRRLCVCEYVGLSTFFSMRIHRFCVNFLCSVTNHHKSRGLKQHTFMSQFLLVRSPCVAYQNPLQDWHQGVTQGSGSPVRPSKVTLVLGRIPFLVAVGTMAACFGKTNKKSKTLESVW